MSDHFFLAIIISTECVRNSNIISPTLMQDFVRRKLQGVFCREGALALRDVNPISRTAKNLELEKL